MKIKKILALIVALSIMATTLATTFIFAEASADLIDISGTAIMSSTLDEGAFDPWPVSQANDGNVETTAGIYGATEDSYIQADFKSPRDIREIVVENANKWGWTGTGKARVIQLSNDPEFASYEEMTCYERVNADNANAEFVDYMSKWSYAGDMLYRYVRIYPTPAAAGYTNWGDDQMPCFAIKELYVYATEKTDYLVNVAKGKFVTSSEFGNTSWDGGPNTADALVDGGKEIYVSPMKPYDTDIITIDLLGDYTVKSVEVATYGNDDPTNAFYVGDGGSIKVFGKKTKDDLGVELTREMNGASGYFPVESGGFISNFQANGTEKYRYIEIQYTEGANAVDMRMPEVRVFAPSTETGNNKMITPVSFGKSVTAGCDATWGSVEGVTDRNHSSNFYAYNRKNGEAWVIIDLGAAYPVELVAPDMGVGGISDVILSNMSDFSEEEYLEENEDGTWTVSEGVNNVYRYVKCVPTVAVSSETDSSLSTNYNEVVVYTTFDALEEIGSLTNIKSKTTLSVDGYDAFWPVAQAIDGDEETSAGIYNYQSHQYIQADFGYAHLIKNIDVTNANKWGWTGTGKVKSIWLSNDPNFNTYEEMVVSERENDFENSPYVDYKSHWTYAGNNGYRYMRMYATPADTYYTNWGSDHTPSFVIKELDIYATEKSASFINVLSSKIPTLTSGEFVFGTTGSNLTDGNKDTVAYGANALAVFELDNKMDIAQVEIDFRADGEVTDADRHYEIYLSNTGTLDGAVKLLGVEENHIQSPFNTVMAINTSGKKFKYVLVGSTANFWGLTEVRAMSNGEYEAPEEPVEPEEPKYEIANVLSGEQEKGSVLTLSTSYTLEEDVNKTVNLYIARYDNGRLTNVVKSGDFVFDGKTGEASLEYTITDVVTAQTEFKGFVWDKVTMEPFAPTAEFAKYAEFWVDPAASENGDGSEVSPFNSLVNARNAVREVIPSMEGDIVINLKGGTYRTDDYNYFVLGNADGGANGYNVIWKNAPGETPVISGSLPVTGFTEGDDGIWYADASDFYSIHALTVNGEAAKIAGTEEPIHATKLYDGSILTGGYTGGIGFSKDDLPLISNPSDALVHVASSWVDVMYNVENIVVDGNNYKFVVDSERLESSTIKELGRANYIAVDKDDYFYVENAKELLDNPGEFYFGDGVLYYMPREGEDMTSATVEAAVTDYLINITGNRDDHAENIVLSGIKFENATYDLAFEKGFTTRQAQVVNVGENDTFVQGSIWVDYADNIEISDCEFTNIAKPCISFVEGVLDSKITRNKFQNIGGSAIVIGTNNHEALEYEGEERCNGNTISDNIIENPAMIFRGSPAITCYYVADTNIVHNKITNCNYTGISLGWGWSENPELTVCANNKVANNYIENVNMIAADGGAIYTLGNLPNAVIEDNYYVQSKKTLQEHVTNGLYFDEGTQNVTARNNVIDMATIKNSGEVYAISAWTDTIMNVKATGNYATFTSVRNEGTNCTIETPTAYTVGSEPAAVLNIISASAMNLK